jgi:hypothetical protein
MCKSVHLIFVSHYFLTDTLMCSLTSFVITLHIKYNLYFTPHPFSLLEYASKFVLSFWYLVSTNQNSPHGWCFGYVRLNRNQRGKTDTNFLLPCCCYPACTVQYCKYRLVSNRSRIHTQEYSVSVPCPTWRRETLYQFRPVTNSGWQKTSYHWVTQYDILKNDHNISQKVRNWKF